MRLAPKAIATVAVSLLCGPTWAQDATLLTNVTIIDAETGTVSAGQSVLTKDGLIAEVGPGVTSGLKGITQFDANGASLIPGC